MKIAQSPELGERFAGLGATQRGMDSAAFRAFLASEYARWGAIVKASGAKVD